MHQPGLLAVAEADRGAAGLEIGAGAAAGDFPVGAGAGQPHLEVVGAGCGKAQIATAEFDTPIGQLQGLQHAFRVAGELLVGRLRVFRAGEPVHLHLVELVQADQAAGVAAVGARLAAEAGGIGGVAKRQLLRRDQLIAVQRGERHLGGGGEPEVVLGAAEALLGKLGQLARGGEAGGVHQDRRQHLAVAGVVVAIQHEVDQGPLQAGALTQECHEAALGDAHGAFRVHQAEAFGDLPVLLQR